MRTTLLLTAGSCAAAFFLAGCDSLAPGPVSLAEASAAGKPGIRVISIASARRNAYVNQPAYDALTPENAQIRISRSDQTARVYAGKRLAVETPVSTGRPAFPTPSGQFSIREKERTYQSNVYGDFVNAQGEVVQKDVNTRTDPVPPGATFRGASMPYWQRLTSDGVGMHVGYVPNRPASHGCLRFPSAVMPMIFEKTKVGTPVVVE
jgi:lipoprotein-anchoring transpeptidase ErfK/SrfK